MTHLGEQPLASGVGDVRSFNRFYTKQIGVLQEGLFCSPFSLTRCACCTSLLTAVSPRPGSFAKNWDLTRDTSVARCEHSKSAG